MHYSTRQSKARNVSIFLICTFFEIWIPCAMFHMCEQRKFRNFEIFGLKFDPKKFVDAQLCQCLQMSTLQTRNCVKRKQFGKKLLYRLLKIAIVLYNPLCRTAAIAQIFITHTNGKNNCAQKCKIVYVRVLPVLQRSIVCFITSNCVMFKPI